MNSLNDLYFCSVNRRQFFKTYSSPLKNTIVRKKILKFSVLPTIFALLFLSFAKKKNRDFQVKSAHHTSVFPMVSNKMHFTVDTTYLNFPILKKNYIGFKTAIGFKESQGHYYKVNKFGYLGKYQFGKTTLAMIGVFDINKFLADPKLQEKAFYANTSRNKWVLKYDIKQFVGKTVGGIKITESGILAAAHLAGPGGVKRYLRSGGMSGSSDAFGTSVKHYLQQFAGYDITFVKADRKAKVENLSFDDLSKA